MKDREIVFRKKDSQRNCLTLFELRSTNILFYPIPISVAHCRRHFYGTHVGESAVLTDPACCPWTFFSPPAIIAVMGTSLAQEGLQDVLQSAQSRILYDDIRAPLKSLTFQIPYLFLFCFPDSLAIRASLIPPIYSFAFSLSLFSEKFASSVTSPLPPNFASLLFWLQLMVFVSAMVRRACFEGKVSSVRTGLPSSS